MDILQAISGVCSALGLSSAAGLNAYVPLLTVAIMQNRGVLHLVKPYDMLGEWWAIAILVVLLIIEIVVDKVPGADHINDVVQTAIRPAAGAILFAGQAGHITWIHPGVWIVLGLLMGGGVHAGKAIARPVVNVGTAGIGAPIVSVVEDLVSVVLAIVAILLPVLAVVLLVVFAWMLWKLFRHFFGGRKHARNMPVEVAAVPVTRGEADGGRDWGGGV